MKKMICDTQMLRLRLNKAKVSPKYFEIFEIIILFLKSQEGIMRDSDFFIVAPEIKRRRFYRALDHFKNCNILTFVNDKETNDDLRNRLLQIQIYVIDLLYEVDVRS